jgi:hypothetical protein
MNQFTIIPTLGRKVDVPIDDASLFKFVGENVAITHDVGGVNFDTNRVKNCCVKSPGYAQWSNSANASATKCLGLFELYDGTNRNHIFCDNGAVYIYDGSLDPVAYTTISFDYDSGGTTEPTLGETVSENGGDASGTLVAYTTDSGTWAGGDAAGTMYLSASTGTWTNDTQLDGSTTGADMATIDGTSSSITFANSDGDFYSSIRVGDYWVFADRAEHAPFKWKNGDDYLTPLITTGTQYKFRYLFPFQRRVVGLYSDQSDGNIEIRWSSDWPTTAISALTFAAANQLYVPNDDPIVGGGVIGPDRASIYCEDSIHDLIYYANHDTPFGVKLAVEGQSFAGHFGIVNIGGRHFGFNRNYGFCEYRGGGQFPYGGRPISEDIETDIQGFYPDYYGTIYGKFIPFRREIAWSVPYGGTTATRIYFYNIDNGHWRYEDKAMLCLDVWRASSNYTWNSFIEELGGGSITWANAGTRTWAEFTSSYDRLFYANTDGQAYYHGGETLNGEAFFQAYRNEPVMHFGQPNDKKLLNEIWFGAKYVGDFTIYVWHRGGDTIGEVENSDWDLLGGISMDSPSRAKLETHMDNSYRYHQIRWGTIGGSERFGINRIDFKYTVGAY